MSTTKQNPTRILKETPTDNFMSNFGWAPGDLLEICSSEVYLQNSLDSIRSKYGPKTTPGLHLVKLHPGDYPMFLGCIAVEEHIHYPTTDVRVCTSLCIRGISFLYRDAVLYKCSWGNYNDPQTVIKNLKNDYGLNAIYRKVTSSS